MKLKSPLTMVLLSFLLINTISFVIYSCKKNASPEETGAQTIVLKQPAKMDNGAILPTGTTISKITNDPHSINVQLPQGYYYVGYEVTSSQGVSTAQVTSLKTVKVTCTCNAGSGCSPFTAGGQVGCLAGKCTNCSMTTSSSTSSVSTTGNVANNEIINGGIINENDETHFMSKNELGVTPSAFDAMFSLKAVQDQVKKLEGYIDPKDSSQIAKGILPSGYQYLPASIFGREVIVVVNKSMTLSADARISDVAGLFSESKSVSCSCNSGSSGCTLKSADFGVVKYCDAGNCTSCTLTSN